MADEKAAADKAAADKAAADKLAADKAAEKKSGATEGAVSVAEAVKKVADAAVAEVKKDRVSGPSPDFDFTGAAGGTFAINGAGFSTNGTVLMNGTQATTTGWGATHIEGKMPAEVTAGDLLVVVHIDDKTKQTGKFTI